MDQGHFVEFNGENWQSVFPAAQAELSQLHSDVDEALAYFAECGVERSRVIVLD